MSNYVTVCGLAPCPIPGAPESDAQALERVIEWWREHLEMAWPHEPDLIVLPEACDRYTAFSQERRRAYYRSRGNQVRDALAEQARARNCYIAYSAARELTDGSWRNATEMLDRKGGSAGHYFKNHLVRREHDVSGLCFGVDAPLIRCDFGTVACAICFDLNFQPLRERYRAQLPDIIAFSSMYHGGLAQKWWAYDCQAYFVGSIPNLRKDILSPQGEILASSTCYDCMAVARINLDRELVHFDHNGEKLDAAKRKYRSKIGISVPDLLGSVLLTSETDEFSVQDVMREFELVSWRDYYAASLEHRKTYLHESGCKTLL